MDETDKLRALATKGGPHALLSYAPCGYLYRKNSPDRPSTDEGRHSVPETERVVTHLVSDPSELVAEPDDLVVFGLRKCTPIQPERILLGRAQNCDLILPYHQISKLHAAFLVSGNKLTGVVDLGSSNGTQLNGIRLLRGETHPLRAGDTLSFGTIELKYVPATAIYGILRASR